MSMTLKKVLAVVTILVILFGGYVTIFGIGDISSAKDALKLGLDIKGGAYVVMEAKQTEDMSEEDLKNTMEQTKAVIENRVNQMGLSEANVTVEGTNRVRVEMPGVENTDDAIKQIGKTAQLQFFLADGTKVLDGSDVQNASSSQDTQNGGYKIDLEFTTEGAGKFEQATSKASSGNVEPTLTYDGSNKVDKSSIVIKLDDEIISAPTCTKTITGTTCEITGKFTKDSAQNLAALIKGGALPVPLEEVQSSVQSATIGYDAFDKSILAGAIGMLLIFILMFLYYRGLGIIASITLILYVILDVWAMIALGAVLTLPGIAAIILSVGMAVDGNVIIFARIKEEIGEGRTPRVAVGDGFKRALTTVLDAQITTLIAAVVLYELGTTAVKGFALTLMLGIVISIFTAVVVTQLFVSLFAESEKFGNPRFFGCKKDGTPRKLVYKQFDILKYRKLYYGISILIVAVGIGFAAVNGFNYGIDFTGGTMLHYDMHEQVDISEVEDTLKPFDLNETIVYGGDENTEIIIKTKEALENEDRNAVTKAMVEKFGIEDKDLLSSEQFGPSVGNELKTNALKAVALAMLGMLIYIIIRFKSWKYGITSIGGTIHDCLILISIYAIFGITINNPFIAGILTVVGYSINDTIVIFDRIRENKRNNRGRETNYDLMNKSINQTLSRSIMTSVMTLIVMVPLIIMVSDAISEFVIPLMIGIAVGTGSSIFFCTTTCYELFKAEDVSEYDRRNKAKEKAKQLEEKQNQKALESKTEPKEKEENDKPEENAEKTVNNVQNNNQKKGNNKKKGKKKKKSKKKKK